MHGVLVRRGRFSIISALFDGRCLALGSWPSAQPASWQYFTKVVGIHVAK